MSLKQSLQKKIPRAFSSYHLFLAWSAARKYHHPSGGIFVIGITGTKGKTTTLELLNAILEAAGKKTALSSSLRIKIAESSEKNETHNSMPGRGYIQNFLKRAVDAGCQYALIEVTSQGVVAHRHRFVDWNIGVLTNLAPEHIESHGSFEKYREAKLAFLKYVLGRGGKVLLNGDDQHVGFFKEALGEQGTGIYSRKGDWLLTYIPVDSPVRASLGPETPKFVLSDFNEENVACAVAIAKELGIGDKDIQKALASFEGVPGRMNFIKISEYTAVVDYAHTPESLEAAYRAVRPTPNLAYPQPRLICVLGAAGGGRDAWKRVEFGKIAARLCDEIVLTNEDPYDEDPQAIIRSIREGVVQAGFPTDHVYEILDRREAIEKAVSLMGDGDVVIGTGKGSEDSIHLAHGKKISWNEKQIFEEVLMRKKNAEL